MPSSKVPPERAREKKMAGPPGRQGLSRAGWQSSMSNAGGVLNRASRSRVHWPKCKVSGSSPIPLIAKVVEIGQKGGEGGEGATLDPDMEG